jgi:hypothetical protein
MDTILEQGKVLQHAGNGDENVQQLALVRLAIGVEGPGDAPPLCALEEEPPASDE